MGYGISQDESIIMVSLRVDNDTIFTFHTTEIAIANYDVIASAVGTINSLIVQHYSQGGPRYDKSI